MNKEVQQSTTTFLDYKMLNRETKSILYFKSQVQKYGDEISQALRSEVA